MTIGIAIGVAAATAGAGAIYIQTSGIPRYEVEKIDLRVEVTPERVARGKKLATMLCALCHMDPTTRQLTGKQVLDAPPQFGVIYSKNITRHPTRGIGSWSDGEIAYLLRTGVRRDGQYVPPWMVKLPHMADEDLWSIIAFLRSDDPMVAPADAPAPGISQPFFLTKLLCRVAWKKLPYPKQPIVAPPREEKIAFGRYLVTAIDCYGCHSADFKTVDIATPERSAGYLGGGNPLIDLRGKTIWSANLTADEETGIGKWSEADFAHAVRKAFRPDGSPIRYPMTPMPELDDDEVSALYAYLRSIPKIRNPVRREVEIANDSSDGKKIYYKYACVSCHGDNGVGVADLRQARKHYPERAQLKAWIRNASLLKPQTKMPTWDGVISENEYEPLISYLLELGAAP